MKNDIVKGFIVCFLLCLTFWGCDEFWEESLSDEEVVIYAPYDGAVLDDSEVTFWWLEIERVNSYHLLVVQPDFESTEKLILDTIVTDTNFTYTFEEGKYSWKVGGLNSVDEVFSENSSFTIKLPAQ